ncbi:MAG: hypothetical protein QM655_03080 [Nocardioidaceae bacterium]
MTAESTNYARQYLRKAQDYLASAQDNLDLDRLTPAAGDAIHSGINAKDAIVVALTGTRARARITRRPQQSCARHWQGDQTRLRPRRRCAS